MCPCGHMRDKKFYLVNTGAFSHALQKACCCREGFFNVLLMGFFICQETRGRNCKNHGQRVICSNIDYMQTDEKYCSILVKAF